MFGTSIKTGKLIVTGIAAAADPGGLVVAGAALDGAIHLYDTLSGQNPKLDKLAAELGKAFHQRLATPAFDKPDGARTLLPQMFEHAITQANTQANFARHGLDPGPILDDMCASFTGHPDWRDEHIKAFRALLLPLLTQACNDPRLEAALRPALTRTAARRQKAQDQTAAQTHEKLDTILERLEAGGATQAALSRDDLEKLARHFLIENVADLTDAALHRELLKKAEDYRRLVADLKALRETTPQLDNVIAQALALLEGDPVNTRAVRALIHDARKTHHESVLRDALEKDAELAVIQARTELFDNRPEQAFTLLSAAADAFAGVDPFEPARRRTQYSELLYDHGLRYGGPGLPLAARMIEAALTQLTAESLPREWGSAQNNLGIVLQAQATRTAGKLGLALFTRAINAYEAALTVTTRDNHPLDWAMTQQNLASALATQAEHTAGDPGLALLTRALNAYEAALTVFTREDHAFHWAGTQQNLANVLATQAERTAGDPGLALLTRAIGAYEAALTITTRDKHPLDWAMTQQNLAIALATQATRTAGDPGLALLTRAIGAYEAALTVFTRDNHPLDWAMTQQNLASALATQATRTAGDPGFALLTRAIDAYKAALTVRTREDHPLNWANTQENLALLHYDWSRRDGLPDPAAHLTAALTHIDAALSVYYPRHTSHDHETATRLRTAIRAALDALPDTA